MSKQHFTAGSSQITGKRQIYKSRLMCTTYKRGSRRNLEGQKGHFLDLPSAIPLMNTTVSLSPSLKLLRGNSRFHSTAQQVDRFRFRYHSSPTRIQEYSRDVAELSTSSATTPDAIMRCRLWFCTGMQVNRSTIIFFFLRFSPCIIFAYVQIKLWRRHKDSP